MIQLYNMMQTKQWKPAFVIGVPVGFVNVEAAVSRQFLSWVIGLGEGVKIAGPESVVARMKDEIRRLMRQYQK